MTVAELIERLKNLDQGAIVRAFDPDSAQFETVSGLLSINEIVEIQTDEIEVDEPGKNSDLDMPLEGYNTPNRHPPS